MLAVSATASETRFEIRIQSHTHLGISEQLIEQLYAPNVGPCCRTGQYCSWWRFSASFRLNVFVQYMHSMRPWARCTVETCRPCATALRHSVSQLPVSSIH